MRGVPKTFDFGVFGEFPRKRRLQPSAGRTTYHQAGRGFSHPASRSGQERDIDRPISPRWRGSTITVFDNILAIARQRPTATRVAGFGTWKDMGRFVKRGEKGIQILAPMIGQRRKSADAVSHIEMIGELVPRVGLPTRVQHPRTYGVMRSCSSETHSRRYAGQFLSSIPLSLQIARKVAESRSASVTSDRSKHIFAFSISTSSRSVSTHSKCTCPDTRNTISFSCPTRRSILKVIGIPPSGKLRSGCTTCECMSTTVRKCLKQQS
jgi:hypothetical protein